MYGVKPACLCAHFHSGGRPGATVGLLPLVPLGLGGQDPCPHPFSLTLVRVC